MEREGCDGTGKVLCVDSCGEEVRGRSLRSQSEIFFRRFSDRSDCPGPRVPTRLGRLEE